MAGIYVWMIYGQVNLTCSTEHSYKAQSAVISVLDLVGHFSVKITFRRGGRLWKTPHQSLCQTRLPEVDLHDRLKFAGERTFCTVRQRCISTESLSNSEAIPNERGEQQYIGVRATSVGEVDDICALLSFLYKELSKTGKRNEKLDYVSFHLRWQWIESQFDIYSLEVFVKTKSIREEDSLE